jgi:general secretion pathway protein L
MQRGAYLIAISPGAVEGGKIVQGERYEGFNQSLLISSNGHAEDRSLPGLLSTFLEQADWAPGMAIVVVPTEVVSFRQLEFAFNDLRKIRQALPYELEDELLEEPERFVYDFDIRPRESGAEVMVYLLERDLLDRVVTACEAHHLTVQRVTFSAQAVAAAHPRTWEDGIVSYLGSDESFLLAMRDGRIAAVSALEARPARVLEALAPLKIGPPAERLQALFAGRTGSLEREPILDLLQEELEGARDEINRFMRIHQLPPPSRVSLQGLFAPFLRLREEIGEVSVVLEREGEWRPERRPFFGVMTELTGEGRLVPGQRGVNFFKRVASWMALLRDLKWPLAVAGVLLVALLGLLTANFSLGTAALRDRLEVIDASLQRELGIRPPLTTLAVNSALARQEDQVARLRKERESASYYENYHYDIMRLLQDIAGPFQQNPRLVVDSLSINKERFILAGIAASYNDSEALKNKLAVLERFKGQTVKITTSRSNTQIRFRISIER